MKLKLVTKFLAYCWLTGIFLYSAMIIGTLTHELSHAHEAYSLDYVTIRYDTSGVTGAGSFFSESQSREARAYLNGAIVETSVICASIISLAIMLRWDE